MAVELPHASINVAATMACPIVPAGRRLHDHQNYDIFKWCMVAFACVFGTLLLACIGYLIFYCVRKRQRGSVAPLEAKLALDPTKSGTPDQGYPEQPILVVQGQHIQSQQPYHMDMLDYNQHQQAGQQLPQTLLQDGHLKSSLPWPASGDAGTRWSPPTNSGVVLAPEIRLAAQLPATFPPYVSYPRPLDAPPYDRLLLLSSRVHQPMQVAAAALPGVAVVVYDWRHCTPQELVRFVKKALGNTKVASLAVAAPGDKPGCVAILDGLSTTAEKLQSSRELCQLWRVLAGFTTASACHDGHRVDLLGCRVVEVPREGAALLKELWVQTLVPFAAADDALGGYALATFVEEPGSGTLSLLRSNIQAMDLYFNRASLLSIDSPLAGTTFEPHLACSHSYQPYIQEPYMQQSYRALEPYMQQPHGQYSNSQMMLYHEQPLGSPVAVLGCEQYNQPLPAGLPPNALLPLLPNGLLPPTTSTASPLPTHVGLSPQQQQPAAAKGDIFERFTAGVALAGLTLPEAFNKYDADRTGQLSQVQVASMVQAMAPGASPADIQHFQAMLDTDSSGSISQQEFLAALQASRGIHSKVKAGHDDNAIMRTLCLYLAENEAVIREYFKQSDKNSNGQLEHAELAGFVRRIPDLLPEEQKYILGFLHQADHNGDGSLSFEELQAAVATAGRPRARVRSRIPMQSSAPPSGPGSSAVPPETHEQTTGTPSMPGMQPLPAVLPAASQLQPSAVSASNQPVAPAAAAAAGLGSPPQQMV